MLLHSVSQLGAIGVLGRNVERVDLVLCELPHSFPLDHLLCEVVLENLQVTFLFFQLNVVSPNKNLMDIFLSDHGSAGSLITIVVPEAVDAHELTVFGRIHLGWVNAIL